MAVAVIGDLHGEKVFHVRTMRSHERTVQLGDCGRDYEYLLRAKIDPEKHKILGGNHDNYPLLETVPHYLGDFGVWQGMFFIRGAKSVDKDRQVGKFIWDENEELSQVRGRDCLDFYERIKPEVMLSHTCPDSIIPYILGGYVEPNKTGELLSQCLEIHRPEIWVFGHFHYPWRRLIDKTCFRCLGVKEVIVL